METDPGDGRREFDVGEERIANELKLKLGIRVSPHTAEKLVGNSGPVRTPDLRRRGMTFVHNHARFIVARDFFIVLTATFRIRCVFVIVELATPRIVHANGTPGPVSEWTLEQFREAVPCDHQYRFVIHGRDCIFSRKSDQALTDLGVRVLRTPARAPTSNSACERLGGILRREHSPAKEAASRRFLSCAPQRPGRSLQRVFFQKAGSMTAGLNTRALQMPKPPGVLQFPRSLGKSSPKS